MTNKFIFAVDVAAGLLLSIVVLMTVAEAALRYTLDVSIPDAYSLSGYAQGIAIAWGIGSATFSNRHINVDIVWGALGPEGRRRLDLFATTCSAVLLALMAWMMVRRALRAQGSYEMTNDLQLPVWAFLAPAAAGLIVAFIFAVLRLVKLFRREPTDAA